MEPFDFRPTTRVVFGPDSIDQVGELAQELGAGRVLLVTDAGLLEAGHVERAKSSLSKAGLETFVFDGVQDNPTSRHVMAGWQFARANHPIDIIIGLGGGSVMDCAKGINFILSNGGLMQDYRGFGKAEKPMFPSIGIPTTAGTGSEAQSYALIADEETKEKMACGDVKVRFSTVILDPVLVQSVPISVAAITGMDAMSHAIESYVSTRSNTYSRMFSREAWRLLATNFDKVLNQSQGIQAWADMLLGAHFAGMAIENSMLGAAHACANPLTANYGIAHGAAVGLMLPHVIRFNAESINGSYDDLAMVLGENLATQGSGAGRLAECIVDFRDRSGLPSRLRDCDVKEANLTKLANQAAHQWTGQFNPRRVTAKELLRLYNEAF